MPVTLEVGNELLDGAEPLFLAAAGLVAVPGELRGDLPDVDLVGELEQTRQLDTWARRSSSSGEDQLEDGIESAHLDTRLLLGLY